jgi:hypothetical protein
VQGEQPGLREVSRHTVLLHRLQEQLLAAIHDRVTDEVMLGAART